MARFPPIHGTTILAVRQGGHAAIAGDGQVTLGRTVMKHTARKIRRLHNGQVLAGFAGSTADAMALFAKFETKIEEYRGSLEDLSFEAGDGVRRAVRIDAEEVRRRLAPIATDRDLSRDIL